MIRLTTGQVHGKLELGRTCRQHSPGPSTEVVDLQIPRHSELVLALLIYVALSAWCQSVIPLDYGPDEPYHMQYIHSLAEHRRLPLPSETYQAHHPPTYYLLAVPLYKLSGNRVEPLGPRPAWVVDKHFRPQEITARRLIRPLSTLLGAMTITVIYALLVVIGVPRMWRLALLLVAGGLPMFIYTTSLVNNEALTYLWSAVVALGLVQLVYRKRPPRWQEAAIIGALVGAGLLIKQTTLFALPVALLVIWMCYRPQRARRQALLTFAAFFLLLGIWWPLHSFMAAGELFPNYAPHPSDQGSTFHEMMTYPDGLILLRFWTRNILAGTVAPDWLWVEGLADQEVLLAVGRVFVLLAVVAALVVLRRAYRSKVETNVAGALRRDVLCVWAGLLAATALWAGIIWFCISVDYRAQSGGRYLLNAVPYLLVVLAVGLRRPGRQVSVATGPEARLRRLLIVGGIIIFTVAVIALNASWLLSAGLHYTSL